MSQNYYPATIKAVEPDSVASKAGLRPGDRLLTINGQTLRDVIDMQVYAAEPDLTFVVERDNQPLQFSVSRRYGQPLGLIFVYDLFDYPMRVCRNNCEFCFVAQMPPGMRPTLYVKDDDYRYSFLYGNYITLTNLNAEDWERIAEQYLSPLYISVHATDPEVRVKLLHNPNAGAIMEQLAQLVDMGIELHTQAVLVPGCNDGEQLDNTISELAGLYPGVRSLSIVPVGLTRWHNPTIRPYTDTEAQAILEQTLEWQIYLRRELGTGFVYPTDEWYLRAQHPFPPLAEYDGQLDALVENGVGMVRFFLDSWEDLQEKLSRLGHTHQTWITGTLFAPLLTQYAQEFTQSTHITANVITVPNQLFGETVTVAGLLTVKDVLAALHYQEVGEALILPEEMFRGPGGKSLDDQFPTALATATGCQVYLATVSNAEWEVIAVSDSA